VQPSFSQAGEDQAMRYLLYNCLNITNPSYLDIGTNHPIICNNTFYFYNRGSRGVCIEPDVQFESLIKKHRKGDIFLRAGISNTHETDADFYVFPGKYSGWNTFSKSEAESREQSTGVKYESVSKVPLVNINQVMSDYFNPHPNIISLDVEGLDLEILKGLNFERFKPEVICVESITFSISNEEQKIHEIIEFVIS
jgi:FkbM family methyltransferase